METGTFRSERTGEVFTIRHKTTSILQHHVPSLLSHSQPHSTHRGNKQTKNKNKTKQKTKTNTQTSSQATRFYHHWSNINTSTGTRVIRYFSQQNHSLVSTKCFATEKVHTENTEERHERESVWTRKMSFSCFLLGLICNNSSNKACSLIPSPPPPPPSDHR